jgi:hypothetical protein
VGSDKFELLILCAVLLTPKHLVSQANLPCNEGMTPTVQDGQPGLIDNCTKKFTPLKSPSPSATSQAEKNTALAVLPDNDLVRVRTSQVDYLLWKNDFTRRTYETQLIQTRIIFVVVLLLVLAGLFFSWVQFQHSFHIRASARKRVEPPHQPPEGGTTTSETFEFGKSGIVIHSAYLGVIILAISMAFFFLYLRFVYPIT